ncbi:MAG: hypothetical protein AB7U83_25185 [Vicinamibacterales bacterium]
MSSAASGPAAIVLTDLQVIFADRLEAFVVYAPTHVPQPSVALVQSLELADLTDCAARSARWQRAGAAIPVLLTRREFAGSLDAFPVEFGEIIATHQVLFGDDPFAGLAVAAADLRRACEGQTRSLLLHLREDYMEAGGDPRAVTAMVVDSAPEFRALLGLLARLDGQRPADRDLAAWAADRLGLDPRATSDVIHLANPSAAGTVDAVRLFPDYLAAVERLARRVDAWSTS